jgi:membrane protease YdiL (CAAX protease family)
MAAMQSSDGRTVGRLGYALACALLVAVGVSLFRDDMGTHRLPIHLLAVGAAAVFWLAVRLGGGRDALRDLGLRRPRRTGWVWVLLAVGIGSGISRYAYYRSTGRGGVQLYEREFLPHLQGPAPERVLRYAVFLAGLYLAVLVPSVLFLGLIQEPFSRAGWLPVGLLLQSAVFGYAHCFMTGSFNLLYGAEAALGGVLSGVAYEKLKEVFVPALLMTSSVFTSTLLLGLSSP